MTQKEPETKHLSGVELRAYLEKLRPRDAQCGTPPLRTATMMLDPNEPVGRPRLGGVQAERRTESAGPQADPVDALPDAPTTVYRRPEAKLVAVARKPRVRLRPSRRGLGGAAALALALSVSWHWLGAPVPPDDATGVNASVLTRLPPAASRQTLPPPTPHPPSEGGSIERAASSVGSDVDATSADGGAPAQVEGAARVSRRGAVDLLFSGATRAALDAYRGLLSEEGPSLELRFAVQLLEQELACTDGQEGPCATP